jgi:hypothetical protein
LAHSALSTQHVTLLIMSGTVEDVRDENYKEFTEAPASIVAYGLATCEPCKTYDPILEQIAVTLSRPTPPRTSFPMASCS